MTSMTARGQLFIHYFLNTGPCGSLTVQESPSHDNIHSSSSNPSIDKFIKELKKNYLEMDVLPDEDWPPSIGRHESNLVLIELERDTLPGAKEANEMLRDYVGGNVDKIREKKKEIKYDKMFSFLKEKSNTKFRMLIDGAPGIGKTTLCRKFCKDWGSEAILQKFSVVWLLNLREERIAKAKAINDLFQHYNTKVQRELLQHIEETGGEGQLLVCDGFEELSKQGRTLFLDIIRGKVLPNCSVIVTSRPYASQMLQQMSRITHHVEIVGFTKEQIKECIRRNITDKPKAEELIKQLKQRLDVLSLCYTPLNAAIAIYVYKQGDHTLPTTLTQLYILYVLHSLKRSVKIHFENLDADDITNLKDLPDPVNLSFTALCKMAYNGLQNDQLGFNTSQLPQSLQEYPGCKSSKPELLSLMSGSKSFTGSNVEVSYQFTHLTVQEFLAAWYAATVLSVEEQSKLFIEKSGENRFRMMLLFLAGTTEMQDTQMYQQIVHHMHFQLPNQNPQTPQEHEISRKQMFNLIFLSHLIYESQNVSLSPILANSVQQDGKLKLMFQKIGDWLECTVVAYFLSTNNFPWKHLELDGITDDNLEVIYSMCSKHATIPDVSTSKTQDTKAVNPPPFLSRAQEVSLQYTFHKQTILRSPSKQLHFSNLFKIKLVCLSVTFLNVSAQVWNYWSSICDVITRHATLQRLHIKIEECSLDVKECEVLQKIFKTNTLLQYLQIGHTNSCLSDLVVGHIAGELVKNHPLKKLAILKNNISSRGTESIFRALVSNTSLKSLNMRGNNLRQSTPNSPLLPTSSSSTSSLSPPSQLLAQPTPALSTTHCQPSPTPHDGGVGAAMADMLSHNSTLIELDVSFCGLTPQSCVSIFKALKNNSSLKKLYMDMNNAFDRTTAVDLADMLSCNRSLTELSIVGYECAVASIYSSRPDLAKAIARGLLRNTTLAKVTVWPREKHSIMAALGDLRRGEGHTQQPDPEVARCEQVLCRYLFLYMCVGL